jgi:Flp pilus assembly protein TadG
MTLLWRMRKDQSGAVAMEMALTAPVFCLLIMGSCEVGYLFWNKFGLQRGVEMAARCAAVNTTQCANDTAIKNYAVVQTYGVNPPSSVFTVTTAGCGIQVTAVRNVQMMSGSLGIPAVTITARSCFPV